MPSARAARWPQAAVACALAWLCLACGGASSSEGVPYGTPDASLAPSATATPATPATPAPTPPPWPTAPAYPAVARAKITTDNLNVRSGPTTTSAAIGLLQPGDEVAIAGRSADSQWLAIVDTGWTVYRAEWIQVTPDYRGLPAIEPRTFTPAMQPPGASSGYPLVDVVVDAVLLQDLASIRQQAVSLSTQCQNAPGIGGPPPCSIKPGATPGTTLEVFPTAACEGEHVLPDRLPALLPKLYTSGNATNAPLRLYAVVEAPKEQSAYFPEGRWVAVFALPDGTGRAVAMNEKGIVRIDFGCDHRATDMLQRRPFEATLFTLPPVLAPPVHPRP